jgi:hypothetical protein
MIKKLMDRRDIPMKDQPFGEVKSDPHGDFAKAIKEEEETVLEVSHAESGVFKIDRMYPKRKMKSYIEEGDCSERSNFHAGSVVEEMRPPKVVNKNTQFEQQMSLSEVDDLVYRMLKDPFTYTRSLESIVYIRNLNYGLILLKTKSLLY